MFTFPCHIPVEDHPYDIQSGLEDWQLDNPLNPLFNFFIELTPLIEVAARVPRHSIPKLQHQVVVFLRHPGCLEVELVKVAPVLKSGKRRQAELNILYSTEFKLGDKQ